MDAKYGSFLSKHVPQECATIKCGLNSLDWSLTFTLFITLSQLTEFMPRLLEIIFHIT